MYQFEGFTQMEHSLQAEILRDVEHIQLKGTPGTMIVYGENATPILTTVKPSDVIMTAATLGLGRIIVCSHALFGKEIIKPSRFPKLSENFRNWLANEVVDDSEIKCIDSDKTVPINKKILVWKGISQIDSKFLSDLKSFILNGGALLCATTPWGYLQRKPGNTLEAMPVYPLLEEIGICFTVGCASRPEGGLVLTKYNKADYAHFVKCINKICDTDDCLEYCDVVQHCCNKLSNCMPNTFKKLLGNVPSRINDKYIFPSVKDPLKDKKGLATLSLAYFAMKCTGGNLKAPGIEEFPGDFSSPPDLSSTLIDITSDMCEHFSTGYYAPAGQTICLKVQTLTGSWTVHIGAHRDDLTKYSENGLKRWPKVCMQKELKGSMELVSPMGGLIYFQNTNAQSSLKLTIENAAEAPYFNLCNSFNVGDWVRRRNAPGLWADISGKYITLTVPSSCVRDLNDPSGIISKWDEVVCAHHELRGTDPSIHRRQWVVTDVQPLLGYMHSGYPIVTRLDVAKPNSENFILNLNKLVNNGNWGLFHEIGHNVQRSNWTFKGTAEVTCNIFTLHALDKICNKKPWIYEWLNDRMKAIKDYLSNGANISDWKNKPAVALCIYAQIIHEFGWEAYKKVFQDYEKLEDKKFTDEEKIDQWITRMSFAVDHDLSPLFEFWGFSVSTDVVDILDNLPPFLPDDEVTRLVQSRVSYFVTDETVRVGPARAKTENSINIETL